MNTSVAGKQETRTALLQVGMEIMMEQGYTNTGIQEVLNALNVPKGSFYHYFDSKESFAVAIIHYFDTGYAANLLRTLRNPQRTPIERLQDHCESLKATLASQDCRKGCFIGNLCQEMADQSEVLRKELSKVMNKWRDMFAACIEEGQKSGEIKANRSAHDLAEFYSSGWSGAMMRAKTVKNTESLDVFIDLMFEEVLKA